MKRVLTASLLAGFFAIVIFCWFRSRNVPDGEFDTVQRYSQIGNAIVHYSWDHDDQLPQRLSDLVPGYIAKEDLALFYPRENQPRLPTNWKQEAQLIDSKSDCVYLGATGIQREILVYEKPAQRNPQSFGRLHIIPPGGGVTSLTLAELDDLLHKSASPVLDRMRRTRVMYYEANLHASLNYYRLDFGVYPKGDNGAVTKVLRGQNPTKKQYHSSYPQERNERGEDLDPWGSPYFVESDGDTVRIKSAGANPVMCLTVTNGSPMANDQSF